MSKFYNNVKSRLNKKGLSGFKKEDYLKAAEQLGIVDLDNVTTDQIIAGAEYLTNQRTNQLVVVSDEADTNLIHHNEPEKLTQQEEEENTVSAIAPLGEDKETNAIALQETQLIQETINNAPNDIKQDLLVQYAEREFQSATELIAFKNEIDSQIDNFLASELHKQTAARNDKWANAHRNIADNATNELTKRRQFRDNFLGDLQARIAEFKF